MSSADQVGPVVRVPQLDTLVGVSTVSDALDALGRRTQVLLPGLTALQPGQRVVGRARTVEFAPVDVDTATPYDDIIAFIDTLRRGEVVVVAAGGSTRSALWGELFSAAALAAGAHGAVIDGYVRDALKVRRLGFPLVSRGTSPMDFRARQRVVATDVAVTVAGVVVSAGDLVAADDDGAAAVPEDLVESVMQAANEKATKETTVLDELLAGDSLRAVWNRHGVL